MDTINCKECGYGNESQRVYCHNCGARLDRSAVLEEARKPKPVKSKKAGNFAKAISGSLATGVKTVCYALLAAALIQAIRPPAGVPVENEIGAAIVDAPSLTVDLEEAAMAPRRMVYSEAGLNEYLKNRIKPSKGGLISPKLARFEKVFLNLSPNTVRITKEYRLLGLPLYFGGDFEPAVGGEKLSAKTTGGNIGRLPIAGLVFDLVDSLVFKDLTGNLAEEQKGLAKMKTITVRPAQVEITSG